MSRKLPRKSILAITCTSAACLVAAAIPALLAPGSALAVGQNQAGKALGKAGATPAWQSQLQWKSGTVFTARDGADSIASSLSTVLESGRRHVVVQFDRPVTDDVRSSLASAGLTLLNYLSDNAFFASLDSTTLKLDGISAVASLMTVRAIETHWKLHPMYIEGRIPEWTVVEEDAKLAEETDPNPATAQKLAAGRPQFRNPIVGALVVFHPGVAIDDAANLALQYGANLRDTLVFENALVVELPYANISLLADEDAVQWIEPPLPRMSELNAENRAITGANTAQGAPYSLTGAGVAALVYDGGQAFAHGDLAGRLTILPTDSSGISDHATHVSGTIAGNGAGVANNKGMAPGASIISAGFEYDGTGTFLYTNPGDMAADYGSAITNFGADISNNSIGTNTEPNGFDCAFQGDYGVTDVLIDNIVRGSVSGGVPFRVVWADGNERQGSRCDVEGFGDYYSTAPPATAKNHITVGALNANDDSMTSFSSWGPTDDGRMKPDISGPGCQSTGDNGVTSCSSGGVASYNVKCGTSMSSPTVCGLSCLVLEDYRVQYPATPDPRNSTLKVIWANTAVDLGNPGPDYQHGYGSVRVIQAIELMRAGNFLENEISQGGTFQAVIIVAPTDTELKVTLAWDDPAGTPNVIPSLINNLDLKVFDSSNNPYHPWTLNPANPSANAVQTGPNTLDNIEQVYIANPAPGAYRVEVTGTSVPSGPQPFSLAASPLLVNCSSTGIIALDRSKYACSSSATIRVVDCDLNTSDLIVDTVNVSIASTTEPGGETVTLTETAAESATFLGSINLATTNSVGVLHIAEGDTVTATYIDADDGNGGFNVPVAINATVDCTPPVITNIQVTNLGPRKATITFTTDEAASGETDYGLSCGSLTDNEAGAGAPTSHSINLTGLTDDTPYYFTVAATDAAGNASSDDNGGVCHTFTTPEVPDFFTEIFEAGDHDLDNKSVLFTPGGGIDQYVACASSIFALPTDPTGGTTLSLTDDSSALVTVGGGNNVQLYGVLYGSFYVGSNGYVTFGAGDSDYTETLSDHFAFPRVAALFDDLNPTQGGTISWKQEGDRMAVTWLNVTEHSAGNQNTCQIELFFDGRIRISNLSVAATDGLAGLSAGTGLDPDFAETDLSNASGCGPTPPSASNASVSVPEDTAVPITLIAADDGTPGPLTYIITSLPTYSLKDLGNSHVIVPGDLPYTLVSNGNQVEYQSSGGYNGSDSFTFKANDGGTLPTGGDSNIATVSLTIDPVLDLPFSDNFPSTVFDSNKWKSFSATIDTLSLSPPSAPNAARFNGDPDGSDEIATHLFNLSSYSAVRLRYSYEQRGGGESPDAADDLFVEYLNASNVWVTLNTHLGADPDMTSFTQVEMLLPPGAFHTSFRLRFRNTATVGAFDDWFVDNISLTVANAPEAVNVAASTAVNSPVTIDLNATDPNGDTLTYIIESLPVNGRLYDPGTNDEITTVPQSLNGGGDDVVYMPDASFSGNDSFTYSAFDGTNGSNIANVAITVGGAVPIYTFPLDTNPGWTTMGQWAWGDPLGAGGDPNNGFTGVNVYGYNLAGQYPNNLTPTQYLTTTALNFTGATGVQLRFRRWLGVESSTFDHANIQVSNNGTTWITVWDHVGASFAETSWSLQTYNIGAVADNQATVFVRWGMGTTDGSVTYSGWNIDDIEFLGLVPGAPCDPCDVNCDGSVNPFDIQPFLEQLIGSTIPCSPCAADTNGNGTVNPFDINDFLTCLAG